MNKVIEPIYTSWYNRPKISFYMKARIIIIAFFSVICLLTFNFSGLSIAYAANNATLKITVTEGNTTNVYEYLYYQEENRKLLDEASNITYISSDKNVATVTSKGIINGISVGKAKITVKLKTRYYNITKKKIISEVKNKYIYLTVLPSDGSTNQSVFKYEITNDKVNIYGIKKQTANIVIPKNISGYPVTTISTNAFRGNKKVKSITCLGNIEQINKSAFRKCESLKKIVLCDTVSSIGDSAFKDCNSLINVTFGKGLKKINSYAFNNCSSLKKLNIPNSIIMIGDHAFEGCSSLENFVVENSITEIGDYAFYNCISLEELMILDNIVSIGEWTFGNCTSLKSADFAESVEKIGEGAFYNCSSIINVPHLEKLKKYSSSVFTGTQVNQVYIGDKEKYIIFNNRSDVDIDLSTTDERNVYKYTFSTVTIPYSIKVDQGNVIVNGKNNTITIMDDEYFQISLNTALGKFFINQNILIYLSEEEFEANKKADEIITTLIKEGMSDLAKVKVLHDYICTHTNHYTVVPDEHVATAYGILVLGNGICAGYQEAYKMLLDKAGVENKNVDSLEYIHGWNAVCIDGEWYHVDTSWDSSYDYDIYYNWFMKNDAEFYAMSDVETERLFNLAHKIEGTISTSTKYSSINWYNWSE